MIIEATDGYFMNLRIKQEWEIENIRVEMYNKNEHFYTFFFSLINDIDKFDNKHNYFAVQKTIEEVNEMGQDNHIPVVDKDTYVTVF
jgi:hypothetical protein